MFPSLNSKCWRFLLPLPDQNIKLAGYFGRLTDSFVESLQQLVNTNVVDTATAVVSSSSSESPLRHQNLPGAWPQTPTPHKRRFIPDPSSPIGFRDTQNDSEEENPFFTPNPNPIIMTGDDTSTSASASSAPPAPPITLYREEDRKKMSKRLNKEEMYSYMVNITALYESGALTFGPASTSGPSLTLATSSSTPAPSHAFPSFRREIRPPEPSKYSGIRKLETIVDWLAEVEIVLEHYGLDLEGDESVDAAATYLTGDARRWWNLEKRKDVYPTTWDAFSEAIKAKYLPPNALENLQDRLHKMQQKGTVSQYVSEFRRTLSLLGDYDENNAFLLFKNGLKPLIRMQVNIANCRDLDAAEQVAIHTESAMQKEEVRPTPSTPRPPKPFGSFPKPSPGPSPTGGPTKLTPQEKEYLRKNNGCYRCRQIGHLSTQCPSYASTSTAPLPATAPSIKPQPSRQSLRLNNAETATQTSTGFPPRQ